MNPIHLIIGPSSQGKSTYISQQFDATPAITFAKDYLNYSLTDDETVVHYNSLRLYKNNPDNYDLTIQPEDDPVIKKLIKNKSRLKAKLLISNKSTLLHRISIRKVTEPLESSSKKVYPNLPLYLLISKLDLSIELAKWIKFLTQHDIDCEFLNAGSKNFTPITKEEAFKQLDEESNLSYTEDDIKIVLDNFRFEYQSIDLPHGLKTPGQQRGLSSNKIFPDDLSGKSVLDIGSAYGFFCFEAEKRNASSVLGTELKDHRHAGANILKAIKESKVQFLQQDIITDQIQATYDVVLLLNVIHHLPFPMYSLDVISRYTKELLIIEFPTIADKKFNKTFWGKLTNKDLPLIGVSNIQKQDQTFVFNESALHLILVENNSYFKKIKFIDSPIAENRRIAFCYK